MPDPTLPLSEYASRRKRLNAALKTAVGVVFAGEIDSALHETFRPHPHFEYLTGIVDEPGAILLLDPGNPVESHREILVLRPLNPELEQWDGLRTPVSAALRDRTGFKVILRYDRYPRALAEAARRSTTLACLHPLGWHTQPVSPDLRLFRRLAERIPGVTIIDRTDAIASLRAVKSAKEVAMIQHAIDITARGFEAVTNTLAPGMNEFDVQETLEHAYRTHGSRGPAYGTIAGSGINSTVLHYRANDRPIDAGDLICIDSGAAYRGYGADVTRTYPASGVYSKRQREVYDVVLAANEAAISATKPGVRIADLHKIAMAIIKKAGFGDFFIHGLGHHLGLETHDVTPDGPLRIGHVITIEPGVYIPDEALGVRIEDDVVVTKTGCRVLTKAIPKSAQAIEHAMADR